MITIRKYVTASCPFSSIVFGCDHPQEKATFSPGNQSPRRGNSKWSAWVSLSFPLSSYLSVIIIMNCFLSEVDISIKKIALTLISPLVLEPILLFSNSFVRLIFSCRTIELFQLQVAGWTYDLSWRNWGISPVQGSLMRFFRHHTVIVSDQ